MTDGVVDEAAFLESPRKLLFILKEANDEEGGNWDLREFLRKGGQAATWNNITRWVMGIRNLPGQTPWEKAEYITANLRQAHLRSVAVMNLNKVPGGAFTNPAELRAVALEVAELLRRQFQLYKADVAICCGVGDIVDDVFELTHSWNKTARGVWFKEYITGKFIISYCHPQVRSWSHLIMYGLVDAVNELYQTENAG